MDCEGLCKELVHSVPHQLPPSIHHLVAKHQQQVWDHCLILFSSSDALAAKYTWVLRLSVSTLCHMCRLPSFFFLSTVALSTVCATPVLCLKLL